MRINDRDKILPVEPRRPAKTRNASGEKVPSGGPDTVSLSDEVQRLRQQRLDRIAELTQKVQSGEYEPDLDAVAAAVVLREGG